MLQKKNQIEYKELLKLITKLSIITIIIDNDIDEKELELLYNILPYNNKTLNLYQEVKSIQKEGDLFEQFTKVLKKIECEEQQLLITKIILKFIRSDSDLDDNEMMLIKIIESTFFNIKVKPLLVKIINIDYLILYEEIQKYNYTNSEELFSIIRKLVLITSSIDGEIANAELEVYKLFLTKKSIDNNIILQEDLKELKSFKNPSDFFIQELSKVENEEQQTFISFIVLKLIISDGTIDKNEINLFNLLQKKYTHVNFQNITSSGILSKLDFSTILNNILLSF